MHLEDVFVTGLLAERCGLDLAHDRTVFPGATDNCALNATNFSLVHYKRGGDKEELYSRMEAAAASNAGNGREEWIRGVIRSNCGEGEGGS